MTDVLSTLQDIYEEKKDCTSYHKFYVCHIYTIFYYGEMRKYSYNTKELLNKLLIHKYKEFNTTFASYILKSYLDENFYIK